ncbi:MAG: beta strand repeat-containing protein, partial [Planctomycetota bacterium]
ASTLGGSVSYTENGSPVVLDSNVRVFDAELSSTNYSGATLTLVRNGGSNSQDLFSATGTLGALTQGGNLTVGGTMIGTVTTNSGGTLTLTFNSSATNTLVNSAMQQIAYANASEAPPSSVQIDWTFSDGNSGTQGTGGALTATGNVLVNITAVNDAPIAVADGATAIEAGGTANSTAGTNPTGNVLTNDTDVDAGDTKAVSGVVAGISASASGSVGASVTGTYGSINIASTGAYTYTVDNSNTAVQALRTSSNTLSDVFTYTMQDAAGLTSTSQITVTIQGANDAPSDLSTTGLTIAENSANGSVVGAITRTDVDSGDTATYSLVDDAGGRFAIHASTGQVTVIDSSLLNFESATSHNITVRVTDAAGSILDKAFSVTVSDVAENLTLTSGNDTFTDASVTELSINGLDGDDVIYGSAGNDNLAGGNGNDTLVGHGGDDTLTGGTGVDTFWVDAGTDTITDLGASTDNLVVSAGATANATAAGNWTATSSTSNAGTATVLASGFDINVSASTGTSGWTLTNSALSTTVEISENFESGATGWSSNTTTNSSWSRFLGQFAGSGGAQGVSKTFNLANGSGGAVIEFDLYRIDSWDGENFLVFVNDAQVLSQTINYTTSFGSASGTTGNISWSASSTSTNTSAIFGAFEDQIIRFQIVVNSPVPTLKLGFGSTLDSGITDESYGIDNVTIKTTASSSTWVALTGSVNADTLIGGSGNDTMVGGAGNDTLTGGAGSDTFGVTSGTDTITDLGNGTDTVSVSAGATANATLVNAWTATSATSNSGTASITALGNSVNLSAVTGSAGWTVTNAGNATAITVVGSANNDTLTGGSGNDALTGGAGNDTFHIAAGTDTVTDLGNGVDNLNISANAFVNATATGAWTATSSTSNVGSANVAAAGNSINVSAASGTVAWNLANTTGVSTLQVNEDFGAGANGWSNNTTTNSTWSRFLGQFDTSNGTQATSKTFALAGGSDLAIIEFDLYRIDSWDGENFLVYVNDTQVVAHALNYGGSFLSASGATGSTVWTASSASANSNQVSGSFNDQIIRYRIAVQTPGTSLKLGFGSTLDGSLGDESFGIDNLTIATTTFSSAAVTLTGSVHSDVLAGGTGNDVLTGGAGNDILTGGGGNDTFIVASESDTITDLGNGVDILNVSAGTTANATAAGSWTATASTSNAGITTVTASGFSINVSAATGSSGWTLTNSGNGTAVTLTGSANADV